MENFSKIMLMGLGDFGSKIVESINFGQANFPKFFINSRNEYSDFNFSINQSLIIEESGFDYDWRQSSQTVFKESQKIQDVLSNVKILFLVVGLGGATGSGAAEAVAKIAKKMGKITIVIATNPLENDSKIRHQTSFDIIENLKKVVDSLILISTEQISLNYSTLFLDDVTKLIISNIEQKISLMIKAIFQKNALVRINSSIIESILANNNFIFVASGAASGEQRATKAIDLALRNHFVDFDLFSSQEMLITINSSGTILQTEINQILKKIRKNFNSDLKFSYGVYFEPRLNDQIEVGIIASQKKHSYETASQDKQNLIFAKMSIF
ncbi:cell division protein FtsZ [Mycoplasma sp. 'Moose RK']|uniref:cell division protein FtsZ n=1 Tax=Mycoplasma sp. 'Moose RK' TaxID=2780095 RepID=UPI0018C21213|nr:cell division protein FtsZ [Mycoplasma sp. 'Moose RK']MBG0730729.1 cell division protein FtsZ [Mycoplasma sp. 'Moose RK']